MSRLRRHVKRGALAAWHLHYGPNMTPMVDVVMVILIFFMASAAVLGPEWFLRSALPRPKGQGPALPTVEEPHREVRAEFTLTHTGSGPTMVTGSGLESATLEALLERLQSLASQGAPEDVAIILRPGPSVPYQDLVRIHETCQELGIVKVGMID